MLSRAFYLVVVVGFVKVKLLNQTQFLELLQGSIDGGQAEARLFFLGSAIDFISV